MKRIGKDESYTTTIYNHIGGEVLGWVHYGGCANKHCLRAMREGKNFHAIPLGQQLASYHFDTLEAAEAAIKGGSQMNRKQFDALRAEVNRLRDYNRDNDYLTPIEERVAGELTFSVRYLGDWEVPADEEDDGDYDWKVPTAATVKRLDALCAKFGPNMRWSNDGEKCWLTFIMKEGK